MRYLIVFAIIAAGASGIARPADAVDRDAAFDEGNARYDAGAWQDAASIYMSIVEEGHVSPQLFLNLGSALYQMDRPGEALYYFMRATRLDPQSAEVRQNITAATDRLGVAVPKVERRYEDVVFWMWIAGCLLLGSGALLMAMPRMSRGISRLPLAAGLIIIIASLAWSALANSEREALVVRGAAAVYESADELSTRGIRLSEGESVRIVEASGPRVLVKARGDISGWIDRHRVREL